MLIHKAMNAFSKISLSPEKTLAGAKGAEPVPIEIRKAIDQKDEEIKKSKEPKRSSDELQTEVLATRSRMTACCCDWGGSRPSAVVQ